MIKADLHNHSTVSDGSNTIEQAVQIAKAKGLDAVCFTEHDTLSHMADLPQFDGIKVLAGIEISAFDYEKNMRVHVLGYNIKYPEKVEAIVHPTLEARHENSLRQIKTLNENGYKIDLDALRRADGKYIYKQHIMDYLVENGVTDEMFGDFYYSVFKNGGICDFDIHYIDPVVAVRAIKDGGGIAVLAHSGQQQNFCLIPELVKNGLDGLELNHHANSAKDKQIILQYAQDYRLFLTGGSDSHGRYEKNSPQIGDFISETSGALAICQIAGDRQ